MPRYIDADLLLQTLESDETLKHARRQFCLYVKEQPTVSVKEVVHGEWIPVTERLPDERHYPPVICGHDKDDWTDAAIVTDNGIWINSDGCEISPTHWMPLPEPPISADMRGEK